MSIIESDSGFTAKFSVVSFLFLEDCSGILITLLQINSYEKS